MKLSFAATIVLAVAIFDSAAGAATTVTEHDKNRAALLRGDASHTAAALNGGRVLVSEDCADGYTFTEGDISGWGKVDGDGFGQVVTLQECADLCDQKGDNCLSYEHSPTSNQCNLNAARLPTGGAYGDFHFCLKGRCAVGYTFTVGDISGWGKVGNDGGGEEVDSPQECANLCAQKGANCLSYEHSPTSNKCNLNAARLPTGGAYEDYLFCYKSKDTVALPNGDTCGSSDDCASGWCHDGVCEALQCFTYDGATNNIPVTQQCKDAKVQDDNINCCTDENGNDACEDLRGTVCVTDSLPTCASTSSCTGAGVGYYGDEVLPVRIEPGSCLSAFSCAYLVNSTVASGSCTSPDSCVFTRDITVGELSCNGSSACQKANGAVIMGSSCNAKNACLLASSQLIMGSSCNGESECAYENERDGRGVEYDY